MEPNTYLAKLKVKPEAVTMKFCSQDTSIQSKELNFNCKEEPHNDLLEAMRAVEKAARFILEFPEDYRWGAVSITGITWSYSEDTDVKGAVITGTIGLDTSDSPFCFNTPHLPYSQYSEGSNAPLMPEFCIALLDKVEQEAIAYFEGKRAQGDLFNEEAA